MLFEEKPVNICIVDDLVTNHVLKSIRQRNACLIRIRNQSGTLRVVTITIEKFQLKQALYQTSVLILLTDHWQIRNGLIVSKIVFIDFCPLLIISMRIIREDTSLPKIYNIEISNDSNQLASRVL
jgi:hypothetical protein